MLFLPLLRLLFHLLLPVSAYFVQKFLTYLVLSELNCLQDLIKELTSLLGNLSVFNWNLCDFFFQKYCHFSTVIVPTFIFLIEIRPCFRRSLKSGKWFDHMNTQNIRQQIVNNFINILVVIGHRVKKDPMCKNDLFLWNFLVAFRQNIIRIFF